MTNDDYTTIRVRESTRDRLFRLKSPGVTYEEVVLELLDEASPRKVTA